MSKIYSKSMDWKMEESFLLPLALLSRLTRMKMGKMWIKRSIEV